MTQPSAEIKYDKKGKGAKFFVRLTNSTPELLAEHPELKEFDVEYPGKLLKHNLLTEVFSTLIGRLCIDPSEPLGGLTFCALGSGDGGWDPDNPPPATGTETDMVAEFFRKSWASVSFVDEFGTPRTVSEAITLGLNTVDFEVSFAEGEGTGSILELGTWGGDATAALGTGTLADYETVEKIPKPANAALGFVFRWDF